MSAALARTSVLAAIWAAVLVLGAALAVTSLPAAQTAIAQQRCAPSAGFLVDPTACLNTSRVTDARTGGHQ